MTEIRSPHRIPLNTESGFCIISLKLVPGATPFPHGTPGTYTGPNKGPLLSIKLQRLPQGQRLCCHRDSKHPARLRLGPRGSRLLDRQ